LRRPQQVEPGLRHCVDEARLALSGERAGTAVRRWRWSEFTARTCRCNLSPPARIENASSLSDADDVDGDRIPAPSLEKLPIWCLDLDTTLSRTSTSGFRLHVKSFSPHEAMS